MSRFFLFVTLLLVGVCDATPPPEKTLGEAEYGIVQSILQARAAREGLSAVEMLRRAARDGDLAEVERLAEGMSEVELNEGDDEVS
jgi:hypothetical protein